MYNANLDVVVWDVMETNMKKSFTVAVITIILIKLHNENATLTPVREAVHKLSRVWLRIPSSNGEIVL
jgi:hypothetical protein